MEFHTHDSVIYSIQKDIHSQKIASFDLDDTIIKTKSGKQFPQSADDWEFWNSEVINKLRKLVEEGYKLIIFTNQKGISSGKLKKETLINKLNQIHNKLGVPFDIFIATSDDNYRKPMTGMWELLVSLYPNIHFKMDQSFYCGDAAGREKNWLPGKKKDFSASDYHFAYNLNIPFEIPENCFLSKGKNKIPFHVMNTDYLGLDLEEWIKKKSTIKVAPYKGQEMILMLGRPGSGKSEFSRKLLNAEAYKNYIYVNMDTCKTKNKCHKITKDAIQKGQSLIIDNTNPSQQIRKEYIELAQKYGSEIYISVYMMDIPEILSKHLNQFRVQKSQGQIAKIPEIAYRIYNKKYQEPTLHEGIDQIIKIPFSFNSNKNDIKMFLYHYNL